MRKSSDNIFLRTGGGCSFRKIERLKLCEVFNRGIFVKIGTDVSSYRPKIWTDRNGLLHKMVSKMQATATVLAWKAWEEEE